ncbi:hypothetical protein Bca52824_018441 [Brassica carinata]|uniref:Uncharacterized protein n=1 Tax=Brassica carinata TaxID=52824 RepID=A0A8X7VQ31_BRACI|nr:hypothetical protein Bca52824_018441 [Brassica carinata]
MKIDMVDDTAFLNVVPFCKKDKDHHPKRSGAAHSDAAAFTIKTIDDPRTLNKTLYLKAAWKQTPYPSDMEMVFIYSVFIEGHHSYFDIDESSGGVNGTDNCRWN